jgi:hypothetical protein
MRQFLSTGKTQTMNKTTQFKLINLSSKIPTIIISRLILRKGFPSSITDFSLFIFPMRYGSLYYFITIHVSEHLTRFCVEKSFCFTQLLTQKDCC